MVALSIDASLTGVALLPALGLDESFISGLSTSVELVSRMIDTIFSMLASRILAFLGSRLVLRYGPMRQGKSLDYFS